MDPTKRLFRGAVVLCGGESRRMGTDKALLPFGDESLLERTVRLLTEVVPRDRIVIVAAAEQSLPLLPPAVRIIRDEDSGRGPVSAISAGLHALEGNAEAAFVTSCDAPLLKPAAVSWLFERLEVATANSSEDDPVDGVVLQDELRLYPLTAVYRTSCAGAFSLAWASEDASMHGALKSEFLNPLFVSVDELRAIDPELDSLVNCNTSEDYEAALIRAGFAVP